MGEYGIWLLNVNLEIMINLACSGEAMISVPEGGTLGRSASYEVRTQENFRKFATEFFFKNFQKALFEPIFQKIKKKLRSIFARLDEIFKALGMGVFPEEDFLENVLLKFVYTWLKQFKHFIFA